MKRKISEEDVEILRKLFVAQASEVIVKDQKECFEFTELQKAGSKLKFGLKSLLLSGHFPGSNSASDYTTIVQIGSSKGQSLAYKKEFRYIRVNGAIRWVFPKGKLRTIFDFYHASTTRGKLLKFGLRAIASLGLDRLVSNKITVHSKTADIIKKCTTDIPFEDFSIFMGTSGVERTVLISLLNGGKSTHFLKIGLNTISQINVGNEGNTLYKLNRESFEHIVVPIVRSTMDRGVITVSKLVGQAKKNSNSFVDQHANALMELASISRSQEQFSESSFGESIIDNLMIIRGGQQVKSPLAKLLIQCFDTIPYNYDFHAGLAHGDFTPWNMFISQEKLYLYDWEASMCSAPSLFDLFHYHFQTGIFLKKWSFNKIYSQIKFSIESSKVIQEEIENNSIELKVHLQLYLLYKVSRKLALMEVSKSNETILEIERAVWKDAMIHTLPMVKDNRVNFIKQFELFLSEAHHAFLKFDAESLELLPKSSDLDIAIDQKSLDKTIQFCKKQEFVKRCRINSKSFMTTVELFFIDNSYLSVDLIHDFRRKWVRFMDINELLRFSNRKVRGFSIPSLEHDIEYTLLFHKLNGAKVPEKYITLFNSANRESQLRTLRYFHKKYELQFSNIDELLRAFPGDGVPVEKHVSKQTKFSLFSFVKSRFNYILDTIKDRIGRRGFVLTFSGVDGVGKTTVIDLVKEQLQSKYRKKVVLMRHRPKVLPILSAFKYGSVQKAEINSTHLDPNRVSKKSVLGSYMRFFYYYLDYVIGQFYIHVRYVWTGKIVLYDRYYFDLINHPQRTNLVVNQNFAKYLYALIIKPSMNIFLCASPDQIIKRKQELNFQQIKQLTDDYLNLFGELSRKASNARYVVHRNDNLSKTVGDILLDIQQIA